MTRHLAYLIGVDGGGTGTRVRVERADGVDIGRATAGPSGLAHGIDAAWQAILEAVGKVFHGAGITRPALWDIGIGAGLAGVHNAAWAAEFEQKNPGFGALAVCSDGYSTLLGAHAGEPGAIVAIGTGSIGEVLEPSGRHREVSGWGFPAGDEAGGAWMGLRAINHAQRMLDGRDAEGPFGHAVVRFVGGSRDALFVWQAAATQTQYATLAPLVVEYGPRDAVADAILNAAAAEVDHIARALDPAGALPVALCGGLAMVLRTRLSPALQARLIEPRGDAAAGALRLLRLSLQG